MNGALAKLSRSWDVRINLDLRYDITHWTRRLGCSEQQLRDAVRAVGSNAAAVRRHLGR